VQIKSVEEAKKIFSEIKQQFPESPFIAYAKKEAELINTKSDLYKTESGGIGETKAVDNVVGNQAGVFNEEKIQEIEPQKTAADKRQTTPSTDGELRNTVGTNETADGFVDRDKPEKSLRAVSLSKKKVKYSVQVGVFKKQNIANELRLQFKRAGYPVQVTKMISRGVYLYKVMIGEFASRKEAESLALKVERTHKLKTIVNTFETIEKAEAPEKIAEVQAPEKMAEVQAPEKVPEKEAMERAAEEVLFPVKNLGHKMERYEGFDIKVKNRMYLLTEVTEYIMNSQSLMNKLGIKEALWRTGNIYEDFINEQILFDETTKLSKVADTSPYKEVIEKYGLTREETDFLYRYFSICDFIVTKLKDMPEEKVVESLTIIYSDGDKYKKTVLSTEIQTYAKDGMSFEDINKLYPDIAKFSVTGIQELQEWVREKVEILRDNEVGVVWSGNGYMVLKPISKKFSCKTSGDMPPETRNKIKAQISTLLNELKTETK
jgi:cell division septation protein DedD